MSFFEELKRRNVFRVGIAYAISAWILLQIVDLVLENISAPDWIMQVFMLALAIGFPVALIFAWAFEMTPDGVKLERDVDRSQSITRKTGQKMNRNIIIALVIAVMFLLVDRFRQQPEADPPASMETASIGEPVETAIESSEKSIAVLPFVDMSPEGDQAYFADGISEEILNVLVKTQSLKVAGRTSSFQFRSRNEDLREIGEQLGVENILEGSIRKANNRVRITAQLVKADDGFHLWSETYDRDLIDIFAIQDEIARAIATALAVELSLKQDQTSLVTASTRNMEAYDRYLEGKGLVTQRQNFPRAIRLLTEVNEMDPGFAAGWASSAQAQSLSYYYLEIDRHAALQKAESMAKRALSLDPDLSMAHSVLGDVYRDRYHWIEANESYLRALALNPDDIEANEQYAQMLWRASYFQEALQYSAKAVRLDPLSWIYLTVDASLHYATGNRSRAWEAIERVMNMGGTDQDFALRHAVRMAISDGEVEKAIMYMTDLATSRRVREADPKLAASYRKLIPSLKSKEETLAFLSSENRAYTALDADSWQIDVFWASFYGDYDLAEAIMADGIRQDRKKGVLASGWLNYAILNPLRNSESYKQMVKDHKLDDFWRKNGFPESCRPLGEDDFVCN